MALEGHVRRKGRWRRRLLATALSLLFALLLAEALLRLLDYSPAYVNPLRTFHQADEVLVYRGRPDIVGRFRRPQFDIEVRHDARGFRAPAERRNPDEIDRTIHVFGDSFTWGWGVQAGEVFTDRLRARLPRHEVRNYGINASGTALQTRLLETEVAAEVRPHDVVVLMFFYNDFFDNTHTERVHGRVVGDEVVEVTPASDFRRTLAHWLKENSYFANFAAHAWDLQKAERRARSQRAAGEHRGPGPGAEELEVTAHFLRRFRDCCKETGAEFITVWVPDSRDVLARETGRGSAFYTAFRGVTERAGLHPLDPTDAFVAAKRASDVPLYYEGDDHWTARGHAVIASVLAQALGN